MLIHVHTRKDIPNFLHRRFGQPLRIVEIGVRYGFNLRRLYRARPTELWGVDHWRENVAPGEKDICLRQDELDAAFTKLETWANKQQNVYLLRMHSSKALQIFTKASLEYVYLDADHSYYGCLYDIAAWWPKIRPGGIIAGHDYKVGTCVKTGVRIGVKQAVTEFRKQLGGAYGEFHTTIENNPSWLLTKET